MKHFNDKYTPDIHAKVLGWMKEGKSKMQVAALLNVNDDTIRNWEKAYPEFGKLVRLGKTHCANWWIELGLANINNKDFSFPMWRSCQRNINNWSDFPARQFSIKWDKKDMLGNMDKIITGIVEGEISIEEGNGLATFLKMRVEMEEVYKIKAKVNEMYEIFNKGGNQNASI